MQRPKGCGGTFPTATSLPFLSYPLIDRSLIFQELPVHAPMDPPAPILLPPLPPSSPNCGRVSPPVNVRGEGRGLGSGGVSGFRFRVGMRVEVRLSACIWSHWNCAPASGATSGIPRASGLCVLAIGIQRGCRGDNMLSSGTCFAVFRLLQPIRTVSQSGSPHLLSRDRWAKTWLFFAHPFPLKKSHLPLPASPMLSFTSPQEW